MNKEEIYEKLLEDYYKDKSFPVIEYDELPTADEIPKNPNAKNGLYIDLAAAFKIVDADKNKTKKSLQ